MTNDEIAKGINNPQAQAEAIGDYNLAKDALERADVAQLFKLYEKAVKQRGDFLIAIAVISEHYEGGKEPRYTSNAQPDENNINAIKEVALAAIKFAGDVVNASKGEAI